MAIVVGDEVALSRVTGPTLKSRGNVLFGIVIDASSGNDIVWENGAVSEAVPSAQLDKILGIDQDAAVVKFSDQSPEYQCVIARGYTRDPAGAGSAVVEYVLLRAISSGQMYEAPKTAITEIPGR